MRILLIEDDTSTAKSIGATLKSEGYVCHTTDLGEEGIEIARVYDHDIIILDLMLPDIDGYEVLRQLRVADVKTPVLVLSGMSAVGNKIKSFGLGADDYLTKPFDRRELVARILAIVRRAKGLSNSVILVGKLSVILDIHLIEVDGRQLDLTSKEQGILELLCLYMGDILTKEAFLDHLYDGIDEPSPKIIDVFICKLRKKLSDASGGYSYIDTIWGRGYVIHAESAEASLDTAAGADQPSREAASTEHMGHFSAMPGAITRAQAVPIAARLHGSRQASI